MAQRARRPTRLSAEELEWSARAGADLRAIFNAPTTTYRERKQLLRAIYSWRGCFSRLAARPPGLGGIPDQPHFTSKTKASSASDSRPTSASFRAQFPHRYRLGNLCHFTTGKVL